jgi:hypothetical protein
MNQDQLRAKALALFHSLVANWADDLRGNVTGIQDQINRHLDSLQELMSKYEEGIDESKVVAFVEELGGAVSAPTGGGGNLAQLRRSMAQLEKGSSLTETLTVLVQELIHFAPRVALFVLKGGACIGWHGQGFDQTPGFSNDALKRISVPANADTVFRAVVTSRQSFLGESTVHRDNVQLLTRIGNVLPSNIFATPLILRDRVAAVIYADSGDSREALSGIEAIEILVLYAGKVLDLRSGAKAARTTSELAPERAEKLRESMSPPVAPSPATGPASSPAVSPPELTPAPEMVEEDSGTVMLDAADLNVQSRPSVEAPSGPPSGPAVETAEPPAKDHEDAKRFARLLVSEIKLYNEAKVEEGRKNKDVYHQLRDDIERSRKLYSERYPGAPPGYFNEELIRVLAGGDERALGQAL